MEHSGNMGRRKITTILLVRLSLNILLEILIELERLQIGFVHRLEELI